MIPATTKQYDTDDKWEEYARRTKENWKIAKSRSFTNRFLIYDDLNLQALKELGLQKKPDCPQCAWNRSQMNKAKFCPECGKGLK